MGADIAERFEAIFNYSSDCIIFVNKQGEIIASNEKSSVVMGEDLTGKNLLDIDKSFEENLEYVFSTGLIQSFYKKVPTSRETLPCHFTFIPIYSEDKIKEVALIVKNVGEVEKLRREVEKLKERIKKLSTEKRKLKSKINGKTGMDLPEALRKLEIANEKLEAINNNLTKELELASILQKTLVSQEAPDDDRLRFHFRFEPMGMVGGDFYDVVNINKDTYGIMVADVSGHGVSSAFISAMFKISFVNYSSGIVSPSEVLKKLNDQYCSVIKTGDYVTAFYTIFDLKNQIVRFSGAGHPMPILYHKRNDTIDFIPSEGFFIGMFENAEYKDGVRTFQPGDKFLAYTDGIIEAYSKEKSEQFGEKRLKESFIKHKDKPLDEMVDAIIRDVKKFMRKSSFYDDLTIVAVEYKES